MSEARRTKMIWYKADGSAGVTINPIWVRRLDPGRGLLSSSNATRSGLTSAEISCSTNIAISVGDVLVDQFDQVGYLVRQRQRQAAVWRLDVLQIPRPFDDYFDSDVLQAYWTVQGSIFAQDLTHNSSLYAPTPVGTTLANANLVYQTVTGDFDCYCQLGLEEVDEFATGTCYLLLAARDAATGYGVGIGWREVVNTFTIEVVRVDYTAVGLQVTAYALVNGPPLMRLKRTQESFTIYRKDYLDYGLGVFHDRYVIAADAWTAYAAPSVNQFYSAGSLQVGFGGWHTSDMSYANYSAAFIRAWPQY